MTFVCATQASAQNLISNGDFETGNFSSWTTAGSFLSVVSGGAEHGTHYGQIGATSSSSQDTLTQTFATVSGEDYDLTFYIELVDTGTPSGFSVYWNGSLLRTWSNFTSTNWTLETFSVVASSASTTLKFSGWDSPSYLGLDNISVVQAVPEPSTWAVLAVGAIVAGAAVYRRRQAA